MSDTPVDPPVPDVGENNATLSDYEDISGECVAPPSHRLSPAQEDIETEEEDSEDEEDSEEEQPQQQQQQQQQKKENDDYDDAMGFAAIILLGGIVLGGIAFYTNMSVTIEHPMARRDYF